jgi:hypothetical protein
VHKKSARCNPKNGISFRRAPSIDLQILAAPLLFTGEGEIVDEALHGSSLPSRVDELHGVLDPIAQNSRNTAVLIALGALGRFIAVVRPFILDARTSTTMPFRGM